MAMICTTCGSHGSVIGNYLNNPNIWFIFIHVHITLRGKALYLPSLFANILVKSVEITSSSSRDHTNEHFASSSSRDHTNEHFSSSSSTHHGTRVCATSEQFTYSSGLARTLLGLNMKQKLTEEISSMPTRLLKKYFLSAYLSNMHFATSQHTRFIT
jgi:hypothetical protein